ncbi:MAG: diguanylate cyclase [Solirubrobacterales bacterium]
MSEDEFRVHRLTDAGKPAPADHLAAIVESSVDAIVSLTLDGMVLSWNRGAESIYGFSAAEALGKSFESLVGTGVDPLPNYAEHLPAGAASRFEQDTVHRRKDGRRVDIALTAAPIGEAGATIRAASIIARDISERKQAERRLAELANQDDLTGLANRRRFHEQLRRHLDRCARHGWQGALLLLDLDRIKKVNDTLGHGAGDQVIKQSADRLSRRLRREDLLGRLGGDEFGVLLTEADEKAVEIVAEGLLAALRAGGNATTSIGAAPIGTPLGLEELMIRADVALYCAKDRGGDTSVIYDQSMDARFEEER